MFLEYIELKNFRNYEELKLNLSSNKILLVGKNAQGKTNLLEAVYYLSNLNSIRTKSDSELIKWNEGISTIRAKIKKDNIETTLDVVLNPPNKKILKVNEIKKNKSSEFCKNITTVVFSTSDLLLLRGTPDDRRSWLDMAICQIYPAFSERLAKYNKIRIQKNNYLKNLKGNIASDHTLLDIWNEQLTIAGSNIIYLRLKFLKEIEKIAQKKHSDISSNEQLTIKYISSIFDEAINTNKANYSVENIFNLFAKKLEEKKLEEIIRGQSVFGPHRDDLSFLINETESRKFASQGQQRTIVLALKLAELELIKVKNGENAILLLDDVLAELDNTRQNYLLNAIGEKTQTIITSVDTLHFDKEYLKNVEIFEIRAENDVAFIKDI